MANSGRLHPTVEDRKILATTKSATKADRPDAEKVKRAILGANKATQDAIRALVDSMEAEMNARLAEKRKGEDIGRRMNRAADADRPGMKKDIRAILASGADTQAEVPTAPRTNSQPVASSLPHERSDGGSRPGLSYTKDASGEVHDSEGDAESAGTHFL